MKSSKVMKNYLYNTLYQVVVLLAPLITTPYVSRVLGAENVGVYHYAQSYVTYFMLIGALGTGLYGQREIAYLQEDRKEYSKAFWEILVFRAFFSFVCAIVFFFVFCREGQYSFVYRVLLFEIIASGIDITWFFTGLENFKRVVIRNILIRITCILMIFIFVKSEEDIIPYTICLTLPVFLGNISLWFGLRKVLSHSFESFSELGKGIKQRIRSIVVLFIPQIAIEVYTVLDKTMIGELGTDIVQVGYYSSGQRIIKIVLMVITSLGTVMLPAMSSLFSKGDRERIKQSIIKAFGFVTMISIALIFGLNAVAYRFVPVFFGKGFDPVADLMIIISPILYIIGASNILGKQYLLPTKQQSVFTTSVVTGAVVNFFLNFILIPKFNAVGASVATVIAELMVTSVQGWHVRKELPLLQCFKPLIRYLPMGLIMFVVVRAVGQLIDNNIIALLVMIFTGIMIYFLELVLTRDSMLQTGIGLIKGEISKKRK